jgi:hypothetical protein
MDELIAPCEDFGLTLDQLIEQQLPHRLVIASVAV